MSDLTLHVATYPDGSQTLITRWPSGRVTVAHRPDRWATWSPPTVADDMTPTQKDDPE